MKKIFIVICSLILSSCATPKWKTTYTSKELTKIKKRYNGKEEFEIRIDISKFVRKPFDKLTRKDIKKDIKTWESIYALMPDSICIRSTDKIDSIYTNKNKIFYITKMKIQSQNIHLETY